MLFVSILLWCLVVYSFWITVFGNPLLRRIRGMPEDAVRILDRALEQGGSDRKEGRFPPEQSEFIGLFARHFFLEMAAFLAEIGLLLFLWHARILSGLCASLLLKDLLVLAIGVVLVKRTERNAGVFATVRDLPGWAVGMDRFSQAVSGAGFALLFLAVNGFMPGFSQ